MPNFLVIWGVTQAAGLIFKPILEDLAKDAAKDWAKDLLKGIPGNILEKLKKEDIEIAAGKALKEFLQLVQEDLKGGELSEDEIKKYTQPIKQFLKVQEVKEILGNAFKDNNPAIDTNRLQEIWDKLNVSNPLPDDFNWKRVAKKYLQKVKEIIQGIPELRDIHDSQNLDKIKDILEGNAQKITTFDLVKYQEGIRERYGNLKLDSLDTSGYAYNELKLWRIFTAQNVRETHQVLAQVHELPKEHLRRLRENDQVEAVELEELERHKRVYIEQPLHSVLDVVNKKQDYKYIVILGDPGSGKSTLLQFMALNWAESPLDNVMSLPIPLLIELRTYMRRREDKECNNFLEFFHQCSGAIHHLNQLEVDKQLKAGNALVMFDGLDEVFDPGKREDVITDIHRFTNDYPDVQVIVTSRIIGYKPQRLLNAEFRHFILQDLDSEQIQDFIYRWHQLTFTDAVDKVRKRERLKRGIAASKSIAELAGNPLLLTMMAILNRNQELPRDRAELYNQASRVLLHQWDVERVLIEDKRLDPKTIDYKDKQAMLRQVAFLMQTGDKGLTGNLINENDLVKVLTDYLKTIEFDKPREVAKVMINQLRTRNFMLCFVGADYYAFVHRTFLEYFCAWEFVWQFKETQTLTIEKLKNEVFGKHWQDESWHEVLLLIAGMIEPRFVGEILDYLMAQDGEEEKFVNLFLAANCLAEVRNRSAIASTATKLFNKLQDLTKYDLWYYYNPQPLNGEETKLVQKICTQAVTAIATTWQESPNTKTWLKERATQDDYYYVRYTAVQELANHFKDDPDTKTWLKERATQDDDNDVRYTAVQELAKNFKDDPDTKTWLKERATQNDDNLVRYIAVQELAKNFKDDPDTKSILKEHATQDDNWDVRRTAVQELAKNFKDDPDTKSILKEHATQDDNWDVRRTAVQELANHFKDDPDTKSILKEYATQDDNNDVRIAAVRELANYFKDDPETKSILKERATKDDDNDVRIAAVRELANYFKDDPDTKSILKECATRDDYYYVRYVAVQELANHFKDDPETKSILKECATQDDYYYVRYVAVQKLVNHFKDDPDIKTWLKECATHDDNLVRYIAVQELANHFKDNPDIKIWLKERATENDDNYVRCAAVQGLADNFKDDPDTKSILKECATHDDNLVRYIAVQGLADNFKDDPDTKSILKECATHDDNWDMRRAAVQELGKYFKYQLELFNIYHNCAVNDPFERKEEDETNPRRIALEIILKQFPQHDQTLPLLRDRAENDPDEQVREFAQKKLKQLEG
ncbi:HEAT repeat domain-containing protein [Nostoc sp. TCL240-02]|uniref:HEAT repeat domain-containing protein n=1 Tax=Nostoc sp. TCL240-02 TaxID=2572090 RepID=UPI00157F8746|nr:HEAT repeat domain-containing protein [Nostoc sp. TCL240-02]QKQ74469.1 NACHT domain-containing protein [Nostoc sp. TCL240-02]